MTTTTTLPAELASDLAAHGIDPARVVYRRNPLRGGDGIVREYPSVALIARPYRVAYRDGNGLWSLRVGTAYVYAAADGGGPRLFASAGAALAWGEGER